MTAEPIDPSVSARMAVVRGKDTRPEMVVRRLVHAMGYRYRLHRCDLPGSPDLVFPGRKKVVFVHGCFWHRHDGCKRASTPIDRADYWQAKFLRNVQRDAQNVADLEAAGWSVLVVWECETRAATLSATRTHLEQFLGPHSAARSVGPCH
ncbi:very short patch repair endonuclease [Methylorubrum zatmanii]